MTPENPEHITAAYSRKTDLCPVFFQALFVSIVKKIYNTEVKINFHLLFTFIKKKIIGLLEFVIF